MGEQNNSNGGEQKSAVSEQVKGAAKKGIKAGVKKLLAMIAPALVPILIVVIVGLVFYSVVSLIGDFFEGIWEGIQNGISDFFNFDTGEIKVPDDKVDEIVKQLKEQYNIDPEDLGLLGDIDYTTATEDQIKEAERKYIKMFIEAQLVTQEINRGGFGLQGRVFVKTPIGDDTTNQKKLTYLAKDNMQNMANSGNINIQNYFSLDETGHILLPSIQITKETGKPETRTIILNSIDYKSMISQYSTPWNLLVYMELVAQNPKFMEKFVDLIKQSEINLSILYNTSYSKETRVHTYTNNVKVTDYKWVIDPSTHLPKRVKNGDHYETHDMTETTIVEYTSIQPQIVVTLADTWVFKREATYKKNTTTNTSSNTDGPYNETAGGDSYKTNEQTVTTIENKNENYVIEGTPIEEYNGGTKGESGTFVWLLDQRYRIPNSSQKRSAGPDLVSGREIFFDRLKQTSNTQGWEPIMRYVLYVYWGQSFGVTDFDLSMFEIREFNSVGSMSAFGTNLTREEFINSVTQYKGSSSYRSKMVPLAGDFYDICTQFNVNPVIAFAHSCLETSYGSGTPYNNYFGHAIYNGASSGSRYASPQDSIRDYCKWIKTNSTIGTSAYASNCNRAQEYGQCNSKLNGYPDTNIYVLYCRYAYLGDIHYCNESSFQNPAGTSYYLNHGSTWGAGGRVYIYEMYEKGALYTGQYAARCGHSNANDPTTTQERADYSEYSTNQRIKIARQIFGDSILAGGGEEGNTSVGNTNVSTYTSSSGKTYMQYKQNVGPWASMSYGNGTIAAQGCSITSVAIALSGYGYNYTPQKWSSGSLTSISGQLKTYASSSTPIGIGGEGYANSSVSSQNKQDIQQHLTTGNVVVIHVLGSGKGYSSSYTSNQHWMALLDIQNNGQVYVSNPNSSGKNGWDSIDNVLRSLCCYIKVAK